MNQRLIEAAKEQFIIKESAKRLESQQANPSPMVSKSLLNEKAKIEAENEWEAAQAPLRKGINVFLSRLESETSAEAKEKIYNDLNTLALYLEEKFQNEKRLDELTVECKLDNLIEALYQCAKDLLKQHSFQNGAVLFRILTILSPQTFDFWLGFGIAQQESGLFQEAELAYKTAKEIYPQNPLPEIYLAETYVLENKPIFAQEALNHAFELIRSSKSLQFQYYLREAEEVQNKIRRKK